ncbi:MAG: 16S rRNA (adenine(1518)-N(6)/adenine(1519)-N(6))-dimethyltransferase RsmA [Clostridia bacterium]|nr:16S rRNA (adenine(1518)-N(6)/adenine(1519)-N(6))-dimethyltransferase RsmA [Clostridia bacterium]
MQKYNLSFHKGLGQNFLYDENYLEKIVDAGEITKDDTVLEIGPGLGVLTEKMAPKAKKVIAVEIDNNIIPALKENLKDFDNVEIINEDILKTDIKFITKNEANIKVIANLPYYITTPIITKLLESDINLERIVIMVQKEVAERLTSCVGTKDYGAITVCVNFFADTSLLFTVPKGAFVPAPKVDSAVVKLLLPKKEPVLVKNKDMFFKTVKGAFSQRRKTLLNSLSSFFNTLSKDDIKNAITNSGFDENIRGEKLDIYDFVKLSENLEKFL